VNRVSTPVLFLAPTLIWGSTWLAITWQLGFVPPEVSVAYRFALAAAILAAWCVATRRSLRFPLREHGVLAALGAMFFGLNYVSIYWAERYVASGLVAVVFSTIVFMSPVGMRFAYGTPLTLRTLLAATLGVSGVALLFLPELDAARHGGAAAAGIGFALLGTAFAAAGNIIAVRNHRANLPIFPTTVWGMAYGALVAALVATVTGALWTFDTRAGYVLSLLYLAVVGSIVAFGAYLTLLKRVGAGPASVVGVATPVIALLLSTLVEGYQWTAVAAFGVAMAVVGNVIALRPRSSSR
jgi:drug/metabolite transporter (DMT)-like permease